MPVIFSEEDRERLTLQIHKNAIAMFEQKGIKKTSIEELAASVGIAKGTFYHFYRSKGELVAGIIREYDRRSWARGLAILGDREKLPVEEFIRFYRTIFAPENTLLYHVSVEDVEWMRKDAGTREFFEPEHAKAAVREILTYLEGLRPDVDYGYVTNISKIINLMTENRENFCPEAYEKNVESVFFHLMQYLMGKEDR